jgi:hypothetical protein
MTEMPTVEVLLAQRREGRTTQLMDWLMKGHRITSYPGWSRILVCAHKRQVVELTLNAGRLAENPWRKCIFTLDDLESAARGAIRPGTVEYAIDDAEQLLWRMLPGRVGLPALISFTGVPYSPEVSDD